MDAQEILAPLKAEKPATAKYLRARLSMAYEYAAMSELHDGRNPFKSLMLPSGNGHTHRKANAVEQAYQRSTLTERRRPLIGSVGRVLRGQITYRSTQ